MATGRPALKAKREQSIPVKVSVDTEVHAPLPPLPTSLPTPQPAKAVSKIAPLQASAKRLAQPVHEWPEEKRRRLMWWLVGGSMAVVILGWLVVVRYEVQSGRGLPNIFTEAAKLLREVHWPGTKQPTKAEQEIRQLDQQVFPQFQK